MIWPGYPLKGYPFFLVTGMFFTFFKKNTIFQILISKLLADIEILACHMS